MPLLPKSGNNSPRGCSATKQKEWFASQLDATAQTGETAVKLASQKSTMTVI